ncbi:MAG: regulatory protein, LuxR [Thermoleophilia bacterium]|nr:regulatory protein, LuxR [Thermoleophilia bacterium]
MRRELPTGTVTLLFSDVEGSTTLLHELGAEAYADVLAEHRRIMRAACTAEGGVEVDNQGDAFFFAFRSAQAALAGAQAMTGALAAGRIQVRIGLHTGTPLVTEDGYVGDDVHLAARVGASGHGGQVVLSRTTRELVDGLPLTDLGEHRLKDIPGAVSIFQLGSERFPPLKTISNTNLPHPESSFIGRERELRELLAAIRSARLVTLTGPGGSGKTRLALEAAATLVPSYKAGVFWVGLASLRDPALVSETIAQTLGAKDGLAEHIGERELLLLLDNLEQVIEAAPQLSALLSACANLNVLVTSRELLRVQGEVEYAVPPLASPEAVALFCERSRLEPSEEIAELCVRLDELPLAVELAAARAKALSPRQILERLSERLDLLEGGRDADPRQQTLRATIDWSYDLLSEEEQRVVRALSVFAGGCTLDAFEEVCSADINTLQSLVEKSLLRFSNERYWMLETIRDYARERLDEAGETDALARRHADYHLALLEERQYPLILGSRRRELLAWFGDEEDNLRATLDYLEGAAPPDAARAAHLLTPFWLPRGRLVEGQERLLGLLARNDFAGGTRAVLLEDLSDLELRLGQLDSAEFHAQEAVTLAQESGEGRTLAFALHELALVASYRGDFDEAIRFLTRVLEEAADDEWLRSIALSELGSLQMDAGRDEVARHMLQEASRGFHATGDEANEASTSISLAYLELYARDFESARTVAASVLEKVRAIGDHYRDIGARNALGFAALGLGRRSEARKAFAESLDLGLASGTMGHEVLSETLTGIALAADAQSVRSAARLRGAVRRLNDEAAFNPSPRWLELEAVLARPLIDALGEDAYARELSIGAALGRDEAITLAQSLLGRPSDIP